MACDARRGCWTGARVSSVVLRPLFRYLQSAGHDLDGWLARLGTSRAQIDDPSQRLPRELARDLWRGAEELTGDPLMGLRVAEHIGAGTMDLFEYLLRASPTGLEALEQTVRYGPLLAEDLRMELHESEGSVGLSFRSEGRDFPGSVWDFSLALWARFAQAIDPPLPVVAVSFTHGAPAGDPGCYDQRFGVAVEFGAVRNQIVFERRALELPQARGDVHLREVLERQALVQLATIPHGTSLPQRVRRIVVDELAGGNPSAEQVARRLHMSKSTLHRRLSEQGSSFKDVLDDVRHGLALRHLERGELQLTEIAHAVGFNDLSAFRKAFRRWEGTTLGEYRSQREPTRA